MGKNADEAAELLALLANKNRLAIIEQLVDKEMSVGAIAKKLSLSQSALSQHLARLRRDGLVGTRRQAQTIFYSLNDKATEAILRCLYDIYSPAKNKN